jgi:O-antigen/teichoic acid export membrane protein
MRTKNAIKIILSSAILQIVVAVSGIILPRFFIQHYGSEVNGLVSSIKQIITYFSMVSLGLGASSSVALYKPLDKKNIEEINGILSATRIFFNRTGYIFAILVSILTLIYPLLVSSTQGYALTASIVFILGIGGISEYIIVSKYRILLIADQKNYIVSKITTQGIVINTIVSVVLIYLNSSIILIQVISTLVYILRLLLTQKYVKKNYPQLNYYGKPNFSAISGRWDAFGYQLPNMIITYTPIILITFFIGLESASIFSVYNMIFSSIAMIVGIFSAGINASFGNVLAKSDRETLQRSYNTYAYIFKIVSFAFYTTALIMTIPFIKIYIINTDDVNYIIPLVATGFAASGLVRSIRIPSMTLVEAAGKFKENKKLNFTEAVSNMLLSVFLIKRFGITGILVAASLSGFVRSIIYIAYTEQNILCRSPRKELANILINSATAIVLSISADYVIQTIRISNFINWFIVAAITFAIVLSIIILLNSFMSWGAAKDAVTRASILLRMKKKNNNKVSSY